MRYADDTVVGLEYSGTATACVYNAGKQGTSGADGEVR